MTDWWEQPVIDATDVDRLPEFALVKLWLAAGYCYEALGETLIPDAAWDHLCRRIDAKWDELPPCNLGHHLLIERAALATATAAYMRPEDYPPFARGTARHLMSIWNGRDIGYQSLPPGRWATVQATTPVVQLELL